MGPHRPSRTPHAYPLIAALALIALLVLAPVAAADSGGTAGYVYKVTGFDYNATGQIDGGVIGARCTVGDAIWEGEAKTEGSELSELHLGSGHLNVGEDGSAGTISAHTRVNFNFSAHHIETTGCDAEGNETSSTTTPCSSNVESKLGVTVKIKGKVGNQVALDWRFGLDGGSLVPSGFSCVKPFDFPPGSGADCTKTSRLLGVHKFTGAKLMLPFKCIYQTLVSPPGAKYTTYGAVTTATGSLTLKRTKQT